MKKTPRIVLVAFLFIILMAPAFNLISNIRAQDASDGEEFYLGVTYGGNSVSEAKALIDKVSNYTNLFVLDSAEISGAATSSALDEICDYAVQAANMSVIVYFYMIYYNVTANISTVYNSTTWDAYGVSPWHVQWLNSTRERLGDKFLGAYLYDEPGGKQIDTGYWGGNNVTFAGTTVRTFANVSDYSDAANRYITSIADNRGMQLLSNTSYPNGLNFTIPAFTADYALYWFDYKAGYNTVFVELGGSRGESSSIQQIALCRGAATAQGKDWGAIITWATNNPPTPENGTQMLADLTLAYNAGAKYAIAFNYNVNGTGGLAENNFDALKQFWTNIHSSPRNSTPRAQVAFVLPANYGWGLRTPDDKIWGLWPADNRSWPIWQNINKLIAKEGTNLDIVYEDPQANLNSYSQTYSWTATITGPDVTPTPLPTPTPSPTPNPTSTPAPEPTQRITENATPTVAPTETLAPTASPTLVKVAEPPNPLLLAAVAIVPTIIVVGGLIRHFTKPKKRNPGEPVFPQVPVKATLTDFGKGTFKLDGETIRFKLKKKPPAKKGLPPEEIKLSQIESLKRAWNQINIGWNGRAASFTFQENDADPVYAGLSDAWMKKQKATEKAAVLPEQMQLAPTFHTFAKTADSLFDLAIGLHGAVDWSQIEGCLTRCQELTKTQTTGNVPLTLLSSTVAQRQPIDAAHEAQTTLKALHESAQSLTPINTAIDQYRPNYSDLKSAISAYYALNDIILGMTVGDDVTNEKTQLAEMLTRLCQETNHSLQSAVLENLNKLQNGLTLDYIAEIRALLAEQLKEILTPQRS